VGSYFLSPPLISLFICVCPSLFRYLLGRDLYISSFLDFVSSWFVYFVTSLFISFVRYVCRCLFRWFVISFFRNWFVSL